MYLILCVPWGAHAHVLDPDPGAEEGELVEGLADVAQWPGHQHHLTPKLYLEHEWNYREYSRVELGLTANTKTQQTQTKT